jgi:hypothetical protein
MSLAIPGRAIELLTIEPKASLLLIPDGEVLFGSSASSFFGDIFK